VNWTAKVDHFLSASDIGGNYERKITPIRSNITCGPQTSSQQAEVSLVEHLSSATLPQSLLFGCVVAREQSDSSLAKTNSIIYITVLSGTNRKPRRSSYARADRT
jgi:hypothetical protein